MEHDLAIHAPNYTLEVPGLWREFSLSMSPSSQTAKAMRKFLDSDSDDYSNSSAGACINTSTVSVSSIQLHLRGQPLPSVQIGKIRKATRPPL